MKLTLETSGFIISFRIKYLMYIGNMSLVDTEHRIVGGKLASITDRPFQVLITERLSNGENRLLCGGSILNSRWILTAAQLLLILTRRIISIVFKKKYILFNLELICTISAVSMMIRKRKFRSLQLDFRLGRVTWK